MFDRTLDDRQFRFPAERLEHLFQIVAAPHDCPAVGNNRIHALLARQFGLFDNSKKRHLAGAPEDTELGSLTVKIQRIVTPFTLGDFRSINAEEDVQFTPVKGDLQRIICWPGIRSFGSSARPPPPKRNYRFGITQ